MTDRAFDDDAEPPAEDAAAPAESGKRRKLLIMVGAPLLAFALIFGGLWATGVLGKLFGHAEEKVEPLPAKQTVFHDLPDLLVNLNTNGRKTNFLKMSISLELDS